MEGARALQCSENQMEKPAYYPERGKKKNKEKAKLIGSGGGSKNGIDS